MIVFAWACTVGQKSSSTLKILFYLSICMIDSLYIRIRDQRNEPSCQNNSDKPRQISLTFVLA